MLAKRVRIGRRGKVATWLALSIVALVLTGCSDSAPKTVKTAPAKAEAIKGTDFKRITVTEKAVQRLGLQTVPVRDAPVIRQRTGEVLYLPELGSYVTAAVAGTVLAPGDAPIAPPGTFLPAGSIIMRLAPPQAPVIDFRTTRDSVVIRVHAGAGQQVIALQPLYEVADINRLWVRVAMSPSEMASIAPNVPATLVRPSPPPAPGQVPGPPVRLQANPVIAPAIQANLALFYIVDTPGHLLFPGQKMTVELADALPTRRIVPYSAVVYDLKGDTWVYTSPQPQVFVREKVRVESVEDSLAILSEGPLPGVLVASVAVGELFGIEFGVGK